MKEVDRGRLILGWLQECLEGLKFVHELRLIHCDLKPENILIRSYSRCEIKIIGEHPSCFPRVFYGR